AILRAGGAMQVETQGVVVRNAQAIARALRRPGIAGTARMDEALAGRVTTVALTHGDFVGLVPGGVSYEVIAENVVTSRWQLRRARGLTRWTGREKELDALGEACRRARAGSGQCIGIVGDAGIGKSRLIHEFTTSAAAAGCRIVESGAFEADSIASFNTIK